MGETIQFGSRTIDFRVQYSVRKSLGITVTPEMEVLVKAPAESSIEKVKEKIRKRLFKFQKHRDNFFFSIPRNKMI